MWLSLAKVAPLAKFITVQFILIDCYQFEGYVTNILSSNRSRRLIIYDHEKDQPSSQAILPENYCHAPDTLSIRIEKYIHEYRDVLEAGIVKHSLNTRGYIIRVRRWKCLVSRIVSSFISHITPSQPDILQGRTIVKRPDLARWVDYNSQSYCSIY